MKYHNLVQGTPEWHAHRAQHYNASDAAAMLGLSSKKMRVALLDEYKTGIRSEPSGYVQDHVIEPGHEFEALARPVAERIVCQELYPVVGSLQKLSASFDGLTMDGDVAWEHKRLNADLREALATGVVPDYHWPQLEQQLLVSGAQRVLFMATDWNLERSPPRLNDEYHVWYESVPERRARLINGWMTFEADLETHEVSEAPAPPPVGRAPEALPALRIEIRGEVTASNLAAFKLAAFAAIRGVNRELQTDEDFANAEKAVGWCQDVESRIAAAKAHALSQTESIEELFRTLDAIANESRTVRLEVDRLVKHRKEAIRGEIVAEGVKGLADHVAGLNMTLGAKLMPAIPADFGAAIKSKRTLATLRDAVDRELQRARQEATAIAQRISDNVVRLDAHWEWRALFPDRAALVLKPPEDLDATIRARIAEERDRQAAKADAERRRQIELQAAQAQLTTVGQTIVPAAPLVAASPLRFVDHMEPATLRFGDIQERLGGLGVAATFLEKLGVAPAKVDKATKLYRESQWPLICDALIAHVVKARAEHGASAQVAA